MHRLLVPLPTMIEIWRGIQKRRTKEDPKQSSNGDKRRIRRLRSRIRLCAKYDDAIINANIDNIFLSSFVWYPDIL